MSFFDRLFGRNKTAEREIPSSDRHVPRAEGWILVTKNDPSSVQQAIADYSTLFPPANPVHFRVGVMAMNDGAVAVTFPDGITTYVLVNLIMWLDAPPDRDFDGHAMGWVTSPSSGLRYALLVKEESTDLLIGQDSEGRAVQLYVPEGTMCELSRAVAAPDEPEMPLIDGPAGHTFEIGADVDEGFGNLSFVLTHEIDTAPTEMSAFG